MNKHLYCSPTTHKNRDQILSQKHQKYVQRTEKDLRKKGLLSSSQSIISKTSSGESLTNVPWRGVDPCLLTVVIIALIFFLSVKTTCCLSSTVGLLVFCIDFYIRLLMSLKYISFFSYVQQCDISLHLYLEYIHSLLLFYEMNQNIFLYAHQE